MSAIIAFSSSVNSMLRADLPSSRCAFTRFNRSTSARYFLSPFAALTALSMRRSRISRSEKISSRLMTSMSLFGPMLPSTWTISPSSKQRTTWTMASTSRMLDKNLLPRPSPLDAPFTRPAMSTNSITAGVILSGSYILASASRRASGTATVPIFGSMVQNG